MKAHIETDENFYLTVCLGDPNGEVELPEDFEFHFFHCYKFVGEQLVLDEQKKAEQEEQENKDLEIHSLEKQLKETDYIISRTFEEIMSLDNSITFIVDFIKILKEFRTKYAEQLKNRKTWRQRIEELKGE